MTQAEGKRLVLHVLTALDFGGVESQMRLIAGQSGASGWTHAFCAIGGGGAVLQDLQRRGMRAEALGCRVAIPSVPAIRALWRHLRRLRPAIVHLHGAEANFHGAIAARLAGVPVVIAEEVGIPRHSAKARRVFAWVYRRCDRVIAISHAVKASILALGEAADGAVEVIHNPFEPQPFRPFPPREGRLVLGFVGRLEPVKNPMAAVEAVALLRDRGHRPLLWLIGEGSLRPALERRIADLDLGDHVRLTGYLADPFARLEGCHFYLQPSEAEGFGLAVCEAMSAGIPVIASAVGGVPEIIEHGRTGWLLPKPDAVSLAAMIETASQGDDASLGAVARAGAASVLERFSVEVYMARCGALYDRLSEAKRVP